MTNPEDWYQDGTVTTYGADGEIASVQNLNPQQLAKEDSASKVIAWLEANIPEGNAWTLKDIHPEMTNYNHSYNCPCWMAVAANGQQFNAGELYWNLFEYATPTQSVVDELHRLAGA
jgi:hypothetical protein